MSSSLSRKRALTKILATGALSTALVLSAAACSDSDETTTTTTTSAADAAHDHDASSDVAHNDADIAFAQGMLPHHEQAIVMSDIILAKADIDPRVIALAQQIKAAQGPEIDTLHEWMTAWGVPGEEHDHGGHGRDEGESYEDYGNRLEEHYERRGNEYEQQYDGGSAPSGHDMPGMLSDEDLQELRDAEGVDASRLFLTQMIAHHEGAVEMAQTEIQDGQNPDAVEMARSIVSSQQAEIDEMQDILNDL
ncbi:MAG: DUF305 domain-containing protein [Rhodococcus sp.]|nr:DUF305 domain-containing protein [Rhodococcus sp. (in: high G+C Gram-positive bacteria)]